MDGKNTFFLSSSKKCLNVRLVDYNTALVMIIVMTIDARFVI